MKHTVHLDNSTLAEKISAKYLVFHLNKKSYEKKTQIHYKYRVLKWIKGRNYDLIILTTNNIQFNTETNLGLLYNIMHCGIMLTHRGTKIMKYMNA